VSALPRISWLRWWWPALVWAALITGFSTDTFSGEHTSRIIVPLLHWLLPGAGPDTLEATHLIFRKCAHVAEYFLFGLLLLRGIRGARRGWRLEWSLAAVAAAAGWAALDELHQAFVPSRGPSMIDVLIDACGAVAGQIVFATVAVLRKRRACAEAGVDSTSGIV
jgi:VanZ family protein